MLKYKHTIGLLAIILYYLKKIITLINEHEHQAKISQYQHFFISYYGIYILFQQLKLSKIYALLVNSIDSFYFDKISTHKLAKKIFF